jgi:hypothetical protein
MYYLKILLLFIIDDDATMFTLLKHLKIKKITAGTTKMETPFLNRKSNSTLQENPSCL